MNAGSQEHSTPVIALAAGLGAVLLWSTTASVSGLLSSAMSYAGLAFYPLLVACIVLGWSVPIASWRGEIRCLRAPEVCLLVGTGVSLGCYELFMFYALTHMPRAEAYILTYLWPIFFMVLRSVFESASNQSIPFLDWIYAAIALVGALLLALRPGESTSMHSLIRSWPALAGAVCVAVYMLLQRKFQVHFSTKRTPLFLSVACSLPIMLLFSFATGASLSWRLSWFSVGLVCYEGVFVFSLGYIAWFFAVGRHTNATLASLIYLVPLLSVFWLNVLLKDPLSPGILYAAVLIVLANFALHSEYHNTSATTASMAFALLAGLVCFLTKGHGKSGLAELIDVSGGAFAVLAAFTLNRVANKNQSERQLLVSVSSRSLVLLDALRGSASQFVGIVYEPLDRLFRRIVDGQIGLADTGGPEALISQIYVCEHEMNAVLESIPHATDEAQKEVRKLAETLYEGIDQWLLLCTERMRLGEFVAVLLLGVLTVVMFLYARPGDFSGDLEALAFTVGIIFVLFAIRDYDENRLDRVMSKTMVLQRLFSKFGTGYYVPLRLFQTGCLTSSVHVHTVRVEIDGLVKHVELPKAKLLGVFVLNSLFGAALVWLLVLLWREHPLH